MSSVWYSPAGIVADGLLDIDEKVTAKMKNGDEVSLFYGALSSGEDDRDTDCWFGFYNEDGEEVFLDDIEAISLADMREDAAG